MDGNKIAGRQIISILFRYLRDLTILAKLPIRELLLFGSLITIIRKREWNYNQAGLP
jgi:hypothetical protein